MKLDPFLRRSLSVIVVAFSYSLLVAAPAQDDPASFETLIKPFLRQHCQRCHHRKEAEGDLVLSGVTADFKSDKNARLWEQVLEALATNEMPPEGESQPTKQDRPKVVAWAKEQLKASERVSEWNRKILYPEYGNLVDHERLFDGSIKQVAWSPSRIWKRNPHIFDSLVVGGMGLGKGRSGRPHARLSKVKQPFTLEEKTGIKDYAAIMFADSATLGTMMRNAETIVDQLIAGALHEKQERIDGPIPEEQLPKDKKGKPIRPRFAKTANEFSQIILADKPPSDQQIEAAIGKMYETIVDREPTGKELEKYRQLFRKWSADGNVDEPLRMTLIAIAISPAAIFRSELGYGPKDRYGRQSLHPIDLAYAIAYALTDAKPDQALLDAATSGRLQTREDVAREVARIWDDDAIAKPRILRFFHEYFGYHHAPKVFKDTSRFGKDYRSVAKNLVQDADTLVLHIVRNDRQVFKELLTTDKYFVGHSGDNEKEKQTQQSISRFYEYFKTKPWREFPYATPKEHAEFARSIDRMFAHPNGNVVKGWMRYLTRCDENGVTPMPRMRQREFIIAYNLDEKTFDFPTKQPFELAPGKRAGITMHPAWLIAHSLNLDNDPVRRGKWIRERLLADTVPDLPITVDARIPEAPDQSLRQRFAVTREQQCWRCHVKMNPLGMPFESFDDFGRHRKREKLVAKGKTAPVDSSGILQGTGDPSLDGNVDNPVELLNRIAQSERARQSFVRHVFRFWMGRNEMFSDSATLIKADLAYVSNHGSFRALVISLLTSDSFLYRKRIER